MKQISQNTRGFTLIEVLISITLSAILMTGILVFVSGSLSSQKVRTDRLSDTSRQSEFQTRLANALAHTNKIYVSGSSMGGSYGTGIFLGSDTIAPVVFIGSESMTGYCDAYSGSASATGNVDRLVLRYGANPSVPSTPPYRIDIENSSILSGSTRIVGTGYPGETLSTLGMNTELNTPSAITRQGNTLYIADTMNRRVLAYDLTAGSVASILSASDGLWYPTGLAFSGGSLLVTDGPGWKVFSIQDGYGTGSVFDASFEVSKPFNADTIRFAFSGIPTISAPGSRSSFVFDNIPSYAGDLVMTGVSLSYVFSGGVAPLAPNTRYGIRIGGLSPAPSTPGGEYFVTASFYQGGALVYSDTFPHTVIGDGSISTVWGNIVYTIAKNLSYPHSPTSTGAWTDGIDPVAWLAGSGSTAKHHSVPITHLSITTSAGLLTIRYREYAYYDCINGRHSTRERVHKIKIP